MCTAITYNTDYFYFGRTLDYGFSYGDEVVITPRNYVFDFGKLGLMKTHYAIIGASCVIDDYPLYYDAVNEKALAIAGLNFVGNAFYNKEKEGKDNIAQYEFIPWILGQCSTVKEVRSLLSRINLTDTPFSEKLPTAQLHWMISDRNESIVVESLKSGLKIYDNPVGVLTNNPPFEMQLFNLNNYMSLSTLAPTNHFSNQLTLDAYSLGMGALGLPGDISSQSRFVRVAFIKMNSVCDKNELSSVSQFFHILGSVNNPKGCCQLEDKKYQMTLYTSCCNCDKGIYYYTAYNNHQISAVDMYKEDLEGHHLIRYPMIKTEQIKIQN